MGKFNSMLTLSGAELRKQRANIISGTVSKKFDRKLNNIEDEILEIQETIDRLEDLGASNAQSLLVGEKLDAEKWVDERFDCALRLRDLEIEKEVLLNLMEEYFGEGNSNDEEAE